MTSSEVTEQLSKQLDRFPFLSGVDIPYGIESFSCASVSLPTMMNVCLAFLVNSLPIFQYSINWIEIEI